MNRWLGPLLLCAALGCGPSPWEGPPTRRERSLFFSDPGLLDDGEVISLSRVLGIISADGHGGRLVDAWFHRFATTDHSERYGPAQLIDTVAADQGAEPAAWDLTRLPFKVTGIHNRIDLATDGHCGELRVSFASTDPVYQPLHLLFLFRQPATGGDRGFGGTLTCTETARAWAALGELSDEDFAPALRTFLSARLLKERFLMAETVEFTIAPWEWRQWTLGPDPTGSLPEVFDNVPLFEAVDPELLNPAGPLRDQFLAYVGANAEALDARRALIPETFRRRSIRLNQGVPPAPLDLTGVPPATLSRFPRLHQQIELVGCPSCHSADADFVQTRPDRSVSAFYDKELAARALHLDALARGTEAKAPFGPLQADPVLPP